MNSTPPPTLTTTVPVEDGVLWITGWHEPRWLCARFTVHHDSRTTPYDNVCEQRTLVKNADWPTTFKIVAGFAGTATEQILRAVLPAV